MSTEEPGPAMAWAASHKATNSVLTRRGLCVAAFLLLLSLPSCRSAARPSRKASNRKLYHHIFVREYVNEEGLREADIEEFAGDSVESPPGPGYVEVTVEQLHALGYQTGEEALAHAKLHGTVDSGQVEVHDSPGR